MPPLPLAARLSLRCRDAVRALPARLAAWASPRWRNARRVVRRTVAGPGRERDLLIQSVKAAAAAVIAWVIASDWLGAPLAFLAPWVALVMVESTVYRSVVKSVQQLLTVVAGVLAAAGGSLVTGNRTLALALALVVMMPLANWRDLGDQGIYGPLTAVFVLTTGQLGLGDLAQRLMETALGAGVGVIVNAAVLPPVHLRNAHAATMRVADEITGLLEEVAGGLRGELDHKETEQWLHRADGVRSLADDAWAAINWRRESILLNARQPRWARRDRDMSPVLLPLEVVAKQAQGICRTLVDAAKDGVPSPDPRFLAFYADVLDHGAAVVRAYRSRRSGAAGSADPQVAALARQRNDQLHERLRSLQSQDEQWIIHAPLLIEVDRLLSGLSGPVEE